MPIVRTRNAQIEFEAHGSPEQLPLILLHGFPDSFRTWDRVIENLKDPLRILVPHLRGFGATRVDNSEALSGRLLGLVTLSAPYLMFQGKRESPAQVRAYWYQWYFNTERGRQAFERSHTLL
jgi:pimeloyl-ACP methyl ester carboxylesterase